LAVGAAGAIDLTHPAVTNLLHDVVGANAASHAGCGLVGLETPGEVDGRSIQESGASLVVGNKQRFDFVAKIGISGASAIEERCTFLYPKAGGLVKDAADLLPSFWSHSTVLRSISR
jgi:hypothetical protein